MVQSTVTVVTPSDLSFSTAGVTTHAALTGAVKVRIIGGCFELSCVKKLTVAIASGATIATLNAQLLAKMSGVTFPVWGTMQRYTADSDTAPDVRRIQLMSDGKVINNGGLVCSIGHTVLFDLKAVGG